MPKRSGKADSLRVAQLHLSYFKAIPGGQRGERHREPPTASSFLKSTATFSEVILFSTSSSRNTVSSRTKPYSFLVFFPLIFNAWVAAEEGRSWPSVQALHQGRRSSAG